MREPLWRLGACEMARGIRAGEYRCADIMEAVVERIRSRNPALNAIVSDYSGAALEQAGQADRDLAAGTDRGPLHGIPVTVKVNVDLAGTPTTNGLPALENLIAPDHSPVVRNLLEAGAIVVGRTNTPELSMRATTDNPLHGRTSNPWDPDASPGGSSGGGGAAGAAGFGPIHHGNDIGGSLRFPSFACGLATVKPTFGRVPTFSPSATAERGMLAQLMSVQGAMCAEVGDVRLATRVMSGPDPRDPWWVPVPFDGPPEPAPLKVAVARATHGYPMHAEIAQGIDRAAGYLSDAGYAVEEVEPPSVMRPAKAWFDVAVSEFDTFLTPVAREHGSETIQRIFDYYRRLGDVVDAEGYRTGIAERTAMTREWNLFLAEYPLVLTPFLMRPMYDWDYDARGFEETRDVFMSSIYSCGTNYLSLPAGVVPIGHAGGRPAGVQIVGRRFREDLILDAMESIQTRTGVLVHELWDKE